MTDYPEIALVGKEELLLLGGKVLSDLYDAASSDLQKLTVQRNWYRVLHAFSASVMSGVLRDDFEVDRCPSDMERCKDGGCMPPGQC